MFVEKVKTDWS